MKMYYKINKLSFYLMVPYLLWSTYAFILNFSIFLINPSPICILDEVDAALDDVNIEKFCLILNELKRGTKTKFLIITHNKITMSSIDRVYGVTMAQKGISDIVSVDLEKVDFQEAS